MRAIRTLVLVLASAALVALGTAGVAQAAPGDIVRSCNNTNNAADLFGLKPWNACFEGGEVRISKLSDLWFLAYPILEDGIKIAGYLAVGLIIWGGIKYSKSQGKPEDLKGAQTTILNALIGLAITVLSVLIVQFITGRFNEV